MNILRKATTFVAIISISLTAVLFSSCEKEDKLTLKQFPELNFEKTIQLTDESTGCTANLVIEATDQSVLDYWTLDRFILLPIKEGQTLNEAHAERFEEFSDTEEQIQVEPSSSNNVTINSTLMLTDKALMDGIQNLALTIVPTDKNELRQTVHAAVVSTKEIRNRTVTINGYNRWYKAFYWVDMYKTYAAYDDKDASNLKSRIRIRKDEVASHSSTCYQMMTTPETNNLSAISISYND